MMASHNTDVGLSCRLPGSGEAASSSSFEVSQQRCNQLEEQIEQQQKVIRYLQAQVDGSKGAAAGPQQQFQAEAVKLRQQLAVLRVEASAGGGGASALQQQVLLLQVSKQCLHEAAWLWLK
jgi:hypothetical protein